MKHALIVAAVLLSACSSISSGSGGAATGSSNSPAADMPSAQAASPAQVAVAKETVDAALKQIRQGRGISLTGDAYIDSNGSDIPAHITGTIAPDGAMDLFISVPFSQGTDVFEVRSIGGHEYTWEPDAKTWNVASLGEPAASGIYSIDPVFMNYPTLMSTDSVRVAPDATIDGISTSVYEITVSSSDQNDQVTTRLWLAKDSGALLQEGVTLSSQTDLPAGLGFNGIVLIQFQPAQSPVSVSAPTVG